MFVPFCRVQRKSTGAVLPGLGCIFKMTRQPLIKGLGRARLSTIAALGLQLAMAAGGLSVRHRRQFRPGKINDKLPGVREMRIQPDARGDGAVLGEF